MDVSEYFVGVQENKETSNQFLLYNHLALKHSVSIRILSYGWKCSFYNDQNSPFSPLSPPPPKSTNSEFETKSYVKYIYLRNKVTNFSVGQIVWL